MLEFLFIPYICPKCTEIVSDLCSKKSSSLNFPLTVNIYYVYACLSWDDSLVDPLSLVLSLAGLKAC